METNTAERTSLRSFLGRALTGVLIAALASCALAATVRLTVRDRWPIVATFFYATPPVVLAVVALACGSVWAARRRWKEVALAVAMAVLFAVWYVGASYASNAPSIDSQSIRVLLWNVNGQSGGALGEEVRRQDPDVACLVEAGSAIPKRRGTWEATLPGREQAWLSGEMLLVVRGTIEETTAHRLDGSWAHRVRVNIRGRSFKIVLVDVPSNPFRSRREAFDRLYALCEAARPDIVLGDFNTPLDSAFLTPMRRMNFSHAFMSAGNGFNGTWPLPVPILAIDHIWCAPSLAVMNCRLVTSASDHRAVVAEIGAR